MTSRVTGLWDDDLEVYWTREWSKSWERQVYGGRDLSESYGGIDFINKWDKKYWERESERPKILS